LHEKSFWFPLFTTQTFKNLNMQLIKLGSPCVHVALNDVKGNDKFLMAKAHRSNDNHAITFLGHSAYFSLRRVCSVPVAISVQTIDVTGDKADEHEAGTGPEEKHYIGLEDPSNNF
jgi:hypothetical protein